MKLYRPNFKSSKTKFDDHHGRRYMQKLEVMMSARKKSWGGMTVEILIRTVNTSQNFVETPAWSLAGHCFNIKRYTNSHGFHLKGEIETQI
jgi:hypothetical protein